MGSLGVWPPLPPFVYLRSPERPWPLGQCTLFAKARNALFAGVRALGLDEGDEILVPTWHHGSEIEALVQAGLALRWYEPLTPDERSLERLQGPRTRALYLIHYLGFPQDGARWRRWCDERGLLLLEDAAMAWLATRDGRPTGSHGDLAIFCLYKTVGVPDGAALHLRGHTLPAAPSDQRVGLRELVRRHGAWLAGRLPARRAEPPRMAVDDLSLGRPNAPSRVSSLLLTRAAAEDVAERRRRNYGRLLTSLHAPEPFDELPDGACPFAFPVETDDAEALLARLASAGIRAFALWANGHPAAPPHPRRGRTIALPVHQALRPDDCDRIASAVRSSG